MGNRLSPDRGARRRRSGLSRAHSLRLRLLGAMVVVFALGLGAAVLSYRTEVYDITSDLRTRTLENQARELLQAVRGRRGRDAAGACTPRTGGRPIRAHRDALCSRYSMRRTDRSPGRPISWGRCRTSPSTRRAPWGRWNSSARALRAEPSSRPADRKARPCSSPAAITIATSSSTACSRKARSSSRSSCRSPCWDWSSSG